MQGPAVGRRRCRGSTVGRHCCREAALPALFTPHARLGEPKASGSLESSHLLTPPLPSLSIWSCPVAWSSGLALQALAHTNSHPIPSPVLIPRTSSLQLSQLLVLLSHPPHRTTGRAVPCCCPPPVDPAAFTPHCAPPGQSALHSGFIQHLPVCPPSLPRSGSAPCCRLPSEPQPGRCHFSSERVMPHPHLL